MAKPKEIVLAFQQAIGKKDLQAARKLLQDTLEFRGPIDTFHKADDYLHAMQKLSAIVEGVDILNVFEEGNDVGLFCDLKTKTFGTSFVAEWYKVNDGKIASVRVVFDARPFAAGWCPSCSRLVTLSMDCPLNRFESQGVFWCSHSEG